MKLIIIVIIALVLTSGGILINRFTSIVGLQSDTGSTPSPAPTTASASATPETSPTGPTTTTLPTANPTATPNQPTASPQNQTSDQFIYPGSTRSVTGSTTVLTTSDNPETVSSWYESQIEAYDLNTRTSVRTTVNNDYSHTLVAIGNGINLDVLITRSPSDTVTTIELK